MIVVIVSNKTFHFIPIDDLVHLRLIEEEFRAALLNDHGSVKVNQQWGV